jgi:hypothetical protein
MRTASKTKRAVAGVTLLDVIFAVVVLGVLAKFAVVKLITPATMTLPTQAQSVADVVRRAQSLAVVRGQRMSVSLAASGPNQSVAIACAASAPCSTDTSYTLSQGAAAVASTSPIYFNSLGQPVNNAGTALTSNTVFTLSYASGNANPCTVTVAALTGRVSVSP